MVEKYWFMKQDYFHFLAWKKKGDFWNVSGSTLGIAFKLYD